MQWYDLTDEEIKADPMALKARAEDYRDSLMASHNRRAVFADIIKWAKDPDIPITAENAMMHAGFNLLIDNIKVKCGLVDVMAELEAEFTVACSYDPKEEQSTGDGLL